MNTGIKVIFVEHKVTADQGKFGSDVFPCSPIGMIVSIFVFNRNAGFLCVLSQSFHYVPGIAALFKRSAEEYTWLNRK